MSKYKKNLTIVVVLCAFALVALWFVVAVLVGYLADTRNFNALSVITAGFTEWRVWLLWFALTAAFALILILRNTYSARRVLKINDGENAQWLTDADIRKSDNMTICSYSKLNSVTDGVPLYAKEHGKTSGFVDPVLQILPRTKTKPGLVITDPKGELLRSHGSTLVKQGYSVLVIDLADPYRSARWNPFNDIISRTQQLNSLKIDQQQGKYIFDDVTYLTYAEAETQMLVSKQQTVDEILAELKDIIYTLCPIEQSQDPSWQQGAQSFIYGIATAMWEDLRDGLCKDVEFNLFSLYKNVMNYAKDDCEVIKEYFNHRERFSKASDSANTVLVATDRTLSSFLSSVNNYMSWLDDSGICALTAENDVDLSAFDEAPTALFLKIPDEKETRHRIVTVLITQMYKILVSKARKNLKADETTDEELKRNVYFIMDEFGNLPKFQNIGNIITVGRSRHIFMLPIIQDYSQLDIKYGKELASSIRNNCNIKVFIGSTDKNTINDFSELCGKTKQKHISFSDQTTDRMSVSVSAESKPLIYPSELETLNDPPKKMGNAIVVAFGKNPFKATYAPVFKAKEIYKPEDEPLDIMRRATVFNEEAHYFDIYMRNAFIRSELEKEQEQREYIEKIMAIENPNEPKKQSAFDKYREIVCARIDSIRAYLPAALATELVDALNSQNVAAFLRGCDNIMDYATETGDRFTLNDAAKLKVFFKNLFKENLDEIN